MIRVFAACAVLASVASAASIGSHVADLAQELGQVKLSGKTSHAGKAAGTRMLVDALLSRVGTSRETLPSNNTKTLLGRISDLLQSILADLLEDRGLDQEAIDEILVEVPACHNTSVLDAEQEKEGTSVQKRDEHDLCRRQQANLTDDMNDKCDALLDALNGIGDFNSCQTAFPDERLGELSTWDNSRIETWRSWLKLMKNAYDGIYDNGKFVTTQSFCSSATLAVTLKADNCNTLQIGFERAYCTWRTARDSRCTDEAECVTDLTMDYNNKKAARVRAGSDRELDARKISYVKCLVDVLRTNTDENAEYPTLWAASCGGIQSGNYSQYNNTIHDIPDAPSCAFVEIYPGSSATEWTDVEYDHIRNFVKAPVPC